MTRTAKAQAGAYPYDITRDEGGFFLLQFADVPEAHTDGETREESEAGALDCLLAALAAYVQLRRDIPRPSDRRLRDGQAALPPLVAAKLALYQAMREECVTPVAPARRLGRDPQEGDRTSGALGQRGNG